MGKNRVPLVSLNGLTVEIMSARSLGMSLNSLTPGTTVALSLAFARPSSSRY